MSWKFLIPIVVDLILTYGVGKSLAEIKALAEKKVREIVPGKLFDDAAWAAVELAWDVILGKVGAVIPLPKTHAAKVAIATAEIASHRFDKSPV
jgi:hypothetical protein